MNKDFTNFNHDIDQTVLTKDELEDLLIPCKYKWELNKYESINILKAEAWVKRTSKAKQEILSVSGLLLLHSKMFEDVWGWAGKIRKTEKNIGITPLHILTELDQLVNNINFQIQTKDYSWEELATNFHHKLVWIHPFVNGNGRHARLATEILATKLKHKLPTWGITLINKVEKSEIRKSYIEGLKLADKGEIGTLKDFIFT